MAKRDTVAERLERSREDLSDWREVLSPDDFKTWKRGIAAKRPKTIDRASEHFALDPADPTDCKVLLLVLAEAVFGKSPKVGRKKGGAKWDTDGLITLGSRLHDLEAKAGHAVSQTRRVRAPGRG